MGTQDSTDKSEQAFINKLNSASANGVPVDVVLKGMTQDEINVYLISQYGKILSQYNELQRQYIEAIETIRSTSRETTSRIEHILSLMTSNMLYIKQLTELVSNVNLRLNEQESINSKQELSFSNIVDRQNRFAQSVANMNSNTKLLMKEIAELKANDIAYDKFKTKVTIIASIGLAAITWLMSGINFSQLVTFLHKLTGYGE